jgi:hypothetical protein
MVEVSPFICDPNVSSKCPAASLLPDGKWLLTECRNGKASVAVVTTKRVLVDGRFVYKAQCRNPINKISDDCGAVSQQCS